MEAFEHLFIHCGSSKAYWASIGLHKCWI